MARTVESEHRIEVLAPAESVYALIADITAWPRIFPTTLHLERLSVSDGVERVAVWTLGEDGQGGYDKVHSWVALRVPRPDSLRLDYRQETPMPPVADMGGSWIVEPLSGNTCLVRLKHDFRSEDDDPATLAWITETLDGFSTAELAAIKEAAEREAARPDLLLTFQDQVTVSGRAQEVYDFLHDAAHWPDRMPHITRAELTPHGDAQILELDATIAPDQVLTTRVARLGLPHRAIVSRQLRLPPLGKVHTVRWLITPSEQDTVTITAEQTVVINEPGIAAMLGPTTTVPEARGFIRAELGNNSATILGHAKAYAESRT